MTKKEVQKRVLQNGKKIALSKFTWDRKTRTFSTVEDNLVLNFNQIDDCTFKTGYRCTFKTGYSCTFDTDSSCTFDTNHDCTFDTGSWCKFDTGNSCTFDTMDNCLFLTCNNCAFKTGDRCTFKTDSSCTFKTGYSCTFKTGADCTFDTESYCNFATGYRCNFDTESYCKFDTGKDCTFDTMDNCLFLTCDDCTFETGDSCTFDMDHTCTFVTGNDPAIITRHTGAVQVFTPTKYRKSQICPHRIPGYIEEGSDGLMYLNRDTSLGEHVIADNILSKVIKKKGNVYKVKNYKHAGIIDTVTYLIKHNDIWSHGETLKEAKESLKYKISNRNTDEYNELTLDTVLTLEEAIKLYRKITGACEQGVRMFAESLDTVPEKLTVKELIELTTGQYGNNTLVTFFNKDENDK